MEELEMYKLFYRKDLKSEWLERVFDTERQMIECAIYYIRCGWIVKQNDFCEGCEQ